MHKGEDSEFYLRKGFRVVAFEADPGLVALCRKRLQRFLDAGKLTIIEGAIVSPSLLKPGQEKILFYQNHNTTVWGTVFTEWADRNARQGSQSKVIEVNAIDFSETMRTYGVPYFMKIDVEGADMICVNSLIEFREKPTYLSLESNKTHFAKIKSEIDFLIKLGYSSFQAIEQSQINSLAPPNPPREGVFIDWTFEFGASGLFGLELGGNWKSRNAILRQYRLVRLGYFLLGDDGIMNSWNFRGAGRLRALTRRCLACFTRAGAPGWYDTHARHSCSGLKD